MTKKILALLLSISCAATMLAGCGGSDSSSAPSDSTVSGGDITDSAPTQNVDIKTSLTIDGAEVDTTDLVMCTINGIEVSFDEFRYYWLGRKSQLDSYEIEYTEEDLKVFVMADLKEAYGILAMGEENEIEYEKTDEETFTDSYSNLLMQFQSEDEYAQWLEAMFLTDEIAQQVLYENVMSNKVYTELFLDGGKYYVDEEAFLEVTKTDDYARVIHILVPYSACTQLSDEDKEGWDELTTQKKFDKLEAAYSKLTDEEKDAVKLESKALADSVLQKAKDGEDFYQLIADYNMDPGMALADEDDITSIVGYYFTKDFSFVQEFLDGSFALKVDEISEVVESEAYGYHIIKRLPVDTEYVEENMEDLLADYNNAIFNKTYDDYLENSLSIEYSEYYDKLKLDSIG